MKKNSAWLAFVLNPLVLLIYGIVCHHSASLAQYGGVARRVPIILAGAFILFVWTGWSLYRYVTYRNGSQDLPFGEGASTAFDILSKWWNAAAVIVLVWMTATTGMNIYQSAVNSQGKLAFYLSDLTHTRKVSFTHDNLYTDGLDGLFADIEEEVPLPEELYVSNVFELEFDRDGQVTSLYSFLYGLNDEKQTESFLLSYDRSKSPDVEIRLDGYTDPAYDEQMKLQPLLDMFPHLPVEEVMAQWEEDTFGIYYAGVRDWGYNTDGIVAMEADGTLEKLETAHTQLVGYTVSVHTPENESLTPMRFIELNPQLANQQAETRAAMEANADSFFVDQLSGYRLTVVDAALGSRFYALEKTVDGGKSWETFNADPFSGTLGTASGITFIDDQLGFIGLSKSGGSYANLYRTTDGGRSFEQVERPTVETPLTETETYEAFDFPEMPYKGNEKLMLLVNQGQDGDYNGGSKALFRSNDDGATWEFVEEVK